MELAIKKLIAFLATTGTMAVILLATHLSHHPSGDADGKTSTPTRKAAAMLEPTGKTYYHQSELKKFAETHMHALEQAVEKRAMECGLVSGIISEVDCTICALFVNGLKDLVQRGSTREDIVAFSTEACIALKIEDTRVCQDVTQEFKEELFGVTLRLSLEPDEVCGYVLGTDCGAPYNPEAMWNVTFPNTPKPPIQPPQPPKPGSATMRVLHLTDLHLDLDYQEGSNADCGEPLCCRGNDGTPAPDQTGAGKYGDYRNCDSPMITLQSLFSHLHSIQDQFDYVIFTGDLPAHNIWNQSRDDQLTSLSMFTKFMTQYLPDKKVYSTMGNHESAPVNSFPPPFVTGNNSESWLYNAVAQSWLHWLPSNTETTIKKGGFYAVQLFPGLRLISLNMNMCNNQNWWLFINDTDPAGMLQWLITNLQDAEDKGDKVYLIGHIMPGCGCCLKPFSWNYYKIVNRYENTIVEQFFGHSHSQYYEMIYDEVTFLRPLGTVYIPGSITTFSNLNPGYRIYQVDGNYQGSSWRVQDYTNYYMNLTDANLNGNPTWIKEYSAKEEYGLDSLFPKDWNNLIYKMKHNDTMFQTFCVHYSKSAPNKCASCTGDCKKNMLCQLKTGRNGDPNLCSDL